MKIINLDTDLRFSNPYGDHWDLFSTWIWKQPYLIRLIQYVGWRPKEYTFMGGHPQLLKTIHDILSVPELTPPVFVFGSNLAGIHGSGTAVFAKRFRGYPQFTGEGHVGSAYGIPIKDKTIKTLPLEVIADKVDRFVATIPTLAELEQGIQITRVGSGRGGIPDRTMALMFKEAFARHQIDPTTHGVTLPGVWLRYFTDHPKHHIVIAGSRTIASDQAQRAIRGMLPPDSQVIGSILSGRARGVDVDGEAIGVERELPLRVFPAHWEQQGRSAGYLRNYEMGYHATDLIAVWDTQSKGTENMINQAKEFGLSVNVENIRS